MNIKSKSIAKFFLITIASLSFTNCCAQIYNAGSRDTTVNLYPPYSPNLPSVIFNVPHRYNISPYNSSIKSDGFSFFAKYPSFIGINDDPEMGKCAIKCYDRLLIEVGNYFPGPLNVDTFVLGSQKSRALSDVKAIKMAPFDIATRGKVDHSLGNIYEEDYYVIKNGKIIFYVACNVNVPGPQCDERFSLIDHPMINVHYTFSRKLLPHWVELHAKIANLINSFIEMPETRSRGIVQ